MTMTNRPTKCGKAQRRQSQLNDQPFWGLVSDSPPKWSPFLWQATRCTSQNFHPISSNLNQSVTVRRMITTHLVMSTSIFPIFPNSPTHYLLPRCTNSATTAYKLLDTCPDAEWRLLFALSRFGGLRCPSETLALTWPDVDWERSRFRVDSPKTGVRWVPIFPELRPYLDEAFELAAEGAVFLITRYRDVNANMRTQLQRIIRRAGLESWPKLFHNLRATRETELAEAYPIHVVCAWIGHAAAIAQKHYL